MKTKAKFMKSPWMTPGLIKSAKNKNKLYSNYLKNPSHLNKTIYTKYKNFFTYLKREAEKNYIINKLRENKNNLKKTWDIIKQSVNNNKSKNNMPTLIESNNDIISTPIEMTETFNNFFIDNSNSAKFPQNFIPNYKKFFPPSTTSSFFISEINQSEILGIVKSMKNSFSQSNDKSSNFFIKNTIDYLLKPLTHCINLSLKSGIFPNCLKMSKIIPIHKNGPTDDIANYRPISIISHFSKILEKVVHSQLINFFEKYNIISNSQYGFKRNSSTELAILDLNQHLLDNIERKFLTIGVFLDISKAFDTVKHDILLDKLSNAGIRGVAHDWFKSYLMDRSQYVSIGSYSSESLHIQNGIPQGSILGPLLFNLFINDLTNSSKKLKYILFADDTTILLSDKSIENLVLQLNEELTYIQNWMDNNCLKINVKKTNYILFGPTILTNQIETQLFYNSRLIPRVNSNKFLGIIITSNLNWKEHIIYLSKKISKNLGIINKVKHLFPYSILLNLYYTMIYPYLLYCVIIWGKNVKNHIIILKRCQNTFLRILFNVSYYTHITPFYAMSNLLSIQNIYILRLLLFYYKLIILKKYSYFQQFLIKSDTIMNRVTRHTLDYYIFQHRTIIVLNSVFTLGIKLWSSLPKEIKLSSSMNSFKKAILLLINCNHFSHFF